MRYRSKRICKVEGCNESVEGQDLCASHYHRAMNRGEIFPIHEKHGMKKTPEYQAWADIKVRCFNPKSHSYKHYGARGITICERWRASFTAFYKDMGPRPEGMSIDREKNDLNYSCGKCDECLVNGWTANCRWATPRQQNLNKRYLGKKTSIYRGVSWNVEINEWIVVMELDRSVRIGRFIDQAEAAWMYDQYAIALYGDDAQLNFKYI